MNKDKILCNKIMSVHKNCDTTIILFPKKLFTVNKKKI